MKRYELKYTIGEDGVFCMSTVENPATKTQLVMFESQEEDALFIKMMIPVGVRLPIMRLPSVQVNRFTVTLISMTCFAHWLFGSRV